MIKHCKILKKLKKQKNSYLLNYNNIKQNANKCRMKQIKSLIKLMIIKQKHKKRKLNQSNKRESLQN